MAKPAALRVIACLLALAAVSCSGYAEGSGTPIELTPDTTDSPAKPKPKPGRRITDAGSAMDPEPTMPKPPSNAAGSASPPPPPSMPEPPDEPVMVPTKPKPVEDSTANIRFARASAFDGYLTDALGQPLYMFVDDVSGLPETACLDQCARDWPPFDVQVAHATADLDPKEIARFHRQDGAWQTTYKGHQLYYRASEMDTHTVTGDGVDGRWFVARDYLAFLASTRAFSPEGGMGTNSSFLTDGFGRTVYVCLEDTPRTATSEAVSSCDAPCTAKRPIFPAAATGRTTLLPSVINAGDLRELERPDGQIQLTYRGWPLYYYSGDTGVGSTEGHNEEAWRAIDPVSFGLMSPTDSSD
jgi:predicted lipoprotein with Yx(FWY)xxD motif